MLKLAWIVTFAGLIGAPVLAQTPTQGSIPDLRGTWKGESESVVFGAGNDPHHGSGPREDATRFTSKPFMMTIDKQDGRRFSGTFSSEHHTETFSGVVARSGTIFRVDHDGYAVGTLLAPNRWESCYLNLSAASRVASRVCTAMVTPGRRTPSIMDRNSCTSGRSSPSSRSWHIKSQRARRSSMV